MLAMVNIKVAPAHLLILGAAAPALAQVPILTPAPAPATPEEVAKSVITNILIVIAPPHTLGAAALALAQVPILTLARAPATRVVPALLATANTPPAPAPSDMNGKMEAAKNFLTAPKVSCITATVRWLVSVLREWTSMSQCKI